MSYEIRSDKHWRISKSGYSIKTGFTDSTRIVASYHAPHGKFDARRFEQWLEDAQHACDLHNASIDGADELERLRAENARLLGDHAAALRLVADVRAAIGDDGKRMQPELIEYCKAMKRDAERYRWLRNESWSLTHGGRKYPRVAQTVVITDPYMRVTLLAEEALDAAIDAAMGGENG